MATELKATEIIKRINVEELTPEEKKKLTYHENLKKVKKENE